MAVIARFSFDVPFGKKGLVFEALKEVAQMEREMGWPKRRVVVGSIGAPESRIEQEYEFESIAALEEAWQGLNNPKLPELQTRFGELIISGSHRWEIFRVHEE